MVLGTFQLKVRNRIHMSWKLYADAYCIIFGDMLKFKRSGVSTIYSQSIE